MKPSRTQTLAFEQAWEAWRDTDTYNPLRDGPRQYRPVWVVERLRRYLPPDQVAMAARLQAAHLEVTMGRGAELCARVDGCGNPAALDHRIRAMGETIRELAGYEQAALTRVGKDGRQCFLGVIEGDGQAELARRAGYPETSTRSVRRLVQITLQALAEYEDENQAGARRWNMRA